MPEHADKRPSSETGALTAGCLLLLVLMADAAAGLLVLIVLAVRGLGRMNADSRPAVTSAPPADWTPVLCFGVLTLAACATGIVLLRLGHRSIGAVQLTLCIALGSYVLEIWP